MSKKIMDHWIVKLSIITAVVLLFVKPIPVEAIEYAPPTFGNLVVSAAFCFFIILWTVILPEEKV